MTPDDEVARHALIVDGLRTEVRALRADLDAARASRDEAVDLLREWAAWYAHSFPELVVQ